jgi:GTP pyrophosphokinase
MDFKKIHDLFAVRIIVKDEATCYKTLGILHKYFKPISEEINDYIAKPKLNGYRSLHTTIFSDENRITEIQIRTEQIHAEAEHGICAHWSYKEKINLKENGKDFEWVNSIRGRTDSENKTRDIPEFWKTFKINFFENQVFALTPKGDIIVLKKDSTPIDFAYAIHSEIGNHCELAKINGKVVNLSTKLENGDIIEIIINKKRNPSKDWLKFVKTSLAEGHIKKFFNQKETFNFPIPGFIKKKIIEIAQAAKNKKIQQEQIKKDKIRHIYLAGQKGMLINVAKCCKPEPGDKVKAYLTKQRSAVLHRTSCKNFIRLSEKFPEKIIDASWD